MVNRPVRDADGPEVTEDLELLRTDDEVLGRCAAAVIVATDPAITGALYALRCEEA